MFSFLRMANMSFIILNYIMVLEYVRYLFPEEISTERKENVFVIKVAKFKHINTKSMIQVIGQ
jgi:hypothetical protein